MLCARHSRCRDAAPARRTFSVFAALGLRAPGRCLAVVGCLLACGPAAHAFRFQVEDAGGSTTSQHNPGTFTVTLTIVSITESGDGLVGIGWFGGSGTDVTHSVSGSATVDIDPSDVTIGSAFDEQGTGLDESTGVQNLIYAIFNGPPVGQTPNERVVLAQVNVRVTGAVAGDVITISVADVFKQDETFANDNTDQIFLSSRQSHTITISGGGGGDQCPGDPNKTTPGVCGCGVSDIDSDGDGTPNCLDGCPNDVNKTTPGLCGCGVSDSQFPNCADDCPGDPNKTSPGICGCGTPETDSDGDFLPDCLDGCPNDPSKTTPGTCGCGVSDSQFPNCGDDCPGDPNKTSPGICGCGTLDTDSDGDSVPNCIDGCPFDSNKIASGDCGCGVPEGNCNDECPNDPNKDSPGLCGCGISEVDSDSDGTPDCIDVCAADPNKAVPGDCGCGTRDIDADGDGTADCIDNCPNDPRMTEPGECGCGAPDGDGDGVPDCIDLCPDGPGDPSVCGCGAPDADGDGTPDCADPCPNHPGADPPGECGCGSEDTDGDGVFDCADDCPESDIKTEPGICGCNKPDVDTDGDGFLDCADSCDDDPNKISPGLCGCGQVDSPIDSDGDGVIDCRDECPDDPDKSRLGVCGCGQVDVVLDSDRDGTPDCVDGCPANPDKSEPGFCGCDAPETDRDGDGTPDCQDDCPDDPIITEAGPCGCASVSAGPGGGEDAPVTVDVRSADGGPIGRIVPGQTIALRLSVSTSVPLRSWSVKLCLGDALLTQVAAFDPILCPSLECAPQQTNVIAFTCDPLACQPLGPGVIPAADLLVTVGQATGEETWFGVDGGSDQTFFVDESGTQLDFNVIRLGIQGPLIPALPLRGDSDGDDDIDLADWLTLSNCLTNPAGPPLSGICSLFDFDFDGTLDLADIVAFQAAFTGSE